MHVSPSTDFEYFRSLMQRPALRRACAGAEGCPDEVVELALTNPDSRYFEVREGDRRLGFMVFIMRSPSIADFHTCLLTLGSRTREAARRAIQAMASGGLQIVLAVYPKVNRAADRLICDLGFIDSDELREVYPSELRETYQFKELRCPGY